VAPGIEGRQLSWDEVVALVSAGDGSPRESARPVYETLAHASAPLWECAPRTWMPLEQALAASLVLAHRDPTLVRVLPLVLVRHWERLSWQELRDRAEALEEGAALGLLVELGGRLARCGPMLARAEELHNGMGAPAAGPRPFFPPRSRYEAELAEIRTPPVVRRWGYTMNMAEDAFASVLQKHDAPLLA
jgi:hypothetical protein